MHVGSMTGSSTAALEVITHRHIHRLPLSAIPVEKGWNTKGRTGSLSKLCSSPWPLSSRACRIQNVLYPHLQGVGGRQLDM